jgi:transketolase
MRNAFVNHLIVKARQDPALFLVVGDLGYSVVDPFVETCSDQFLNAGVAEQNMTAVACGLAREGYHVFTYSIGNFTTLRCLEQIRNDLCYHGLPVCVVSVGGGYMYGSLGPTHHLTEDIAIMRTLPGMRVFVPFSKVSARKALDEVLSVREPAYIRLGREGVAWEDVEHNGLTQIVKSEKARRAYLSVGQLSADRLERAEAEDADLYAWCRIHPLPTDDLDRILDRYEEVVVMEDHQRNGGAFGALSEHDSRIGSIAVDGAFSSWVGKEQDLRAKMLKERMPGRGE